MSKKKYYKWIVPNIVEMTYKVGETNYEVEALVLYKLLLKQLCWQILRTDGNLEKIGNMKAWLEEFKRQ